MALPHGTLVDFTTTTPGYEWLDQLDLRAAADQILTHRDSDAVVADTPTGTQGTPS